MTPAHLPPSTALLNQAINDPAIGDAEFRTYSRLYARAWRHDYRYTDPMDYKGELIPLIGSHGAARRHMNSLRRAGYLDWTTNGAGQYVFTFPSPTFGTQEPEIEHPVGDPSPTNGTPGTTFGTSTDELSPTFGTQSELSPKNGTPGTTFGTQNEPFEAPVPGGSQVGEAGRLINLINLTTLPTSLTLKPGDPLLEKILEFTPLLFAGEPMWRPRKPVRLVVVLGHLAQAWHEKTLGVKGKPARLAHIRIKNGWLPEPVYLADPFAYLPDEFLRAAGLEAFIPLPAEQPDQDPPAEEQPAGDVPIPEDPSINTPVSPGGPRAARAWEETIQTLEGEMSPQAFEKWVRPARLRHYADGGFEIAAPNAYTRDWLQSRLASTITRQLTGICNRQVAVSFVVEGR